MNASATTRKRLTLVDLEKRVAASGRGTPPGRARASAAALGADVLSQIDLLSGRSQWSRKRGLAALLAVPSGRTRKDGGATARAYDVGAPIQTNGQTVAAFGASFGADGGSWRSFAYREDDDPITTGFAVEVFEDDPRVAAPAEAPPAPPAVPAAVPVMASPTVTPQPAAPVDVPVAAALAAGQREDGYLGLDLSAAAATDREDAEQFEREIQAILAGKTTRPAAQSASGDMPASVPAPAPPPAPRPHDIFEQMGQNMAYATAFHLPPMELGRRFDELEREITRDEEVQTRRPSDLSLELTDDDISESLGLGRALQTTPPAITVAPGTSPPDAPPVATLPPEPVPTAPPPSAPVAEAPAPVNEPAATDAVQPAQDGRANP